MELVAGLHELVVPLVCTRVARDKRKHLLLVQELLAAWPRTERQLHPPRSTREAYCSTPHMMDEDMIMAVLTKLEDLLYEPYVDDEGTVWNKPSDEGQQFQDELEAFQGRSMKVFAGGGRGGGGRGGDDGTGFDLRATDLHKEFCTLVETTVMRFIAENYGGATAASFAEMLGGVRTNAAAASWQREGAKEIVTLLNEVSDFQFWAKGMQRKAAAAAARKDRRREGDSDASSDEEDGSNEDDERGSGGGREGKDGGGGEIEARYSHK